MGKYYERLKEDVRFIEALNSCMNCGVCTAVCPAAEFYNYDPRQIVSTVQTRNEEAIESLLKSETIWYCGECMSCKPRCPRGNTPGGVIQALRTLSQKEGFFIESEKGRQQLAVKRTIGENILNTGYCIIPKTVAPDMHPEQGAVWEWIWEHDQDIFECFTENYRQAGAGAMRRINEDCLDEVRRIFDVTGGTAFFEQIERQSEEAARQMGMDSHSDQYIGELFTANNGEHFRE
ncbi:MAG: 4Fe-4S dicluster domain-containing protein [Rikenellaceae bacterium]|jgi:heterodisulfide reductase subunit C|nr:4Fe-4S dicluster domain-containing protein [Rikenellaceae bacterium]